VSDEDTVASIVRAELPAERIRRSESFIVRLVVALRARIRIAGLAEGNDNDLQRRVRTRGCKRSGKHGERQPCDAEAGRKRAVRHSLHEE